MRKPESIQERMAQVRKAQAAGTYTRCPRCGENTMKLGDRLCTNALSRQYDIMVCDLCGMDEAVMAIMGAPKPLAHWACLNQQCREDFKDTPGAQALRTIEDTQIDYLLSLLRLYRAQPAQTDWEAWRLDAYEQCPGLTTLWFEPFVARYRVAEGVLVISTVREWAQVTRIAGTAPSFMGYSRFENAATQSRSDSRSLHSSKKLFPGS